MDDIINAQADDIKRVISINDDQIHFCGLYYNTARSIFVCEIKHLLYYLIGLSFDIYILMSAYEI